MQYNTIKIKIHQWWTCPHFLSGKSNVFNNDMIYVSFEIKTEIEISIETKQGSHHAGAFFKSNPSCTLNLIKDRINRVQTRKGKHFRVKLLKLLFFVKRFTETVIAVTQ